MKVGVTVEELDGIWIAEVGSLGDTLLDSLLGKVKLTKLRRKAYPTQELMESGIVNLLRECVAEAKELAETDAS
jgi:hypothetical protein